MQVNTKMEYIEQALRLKPELDKLRPINPEQEAIILQKFRLDWDYHSNHLEGNSLTYGETKALIMFGITAQGKPLKDHFEITGHDEAIKWVIDIIKEERPLTEKFIRELHVLLLKNPYEVDAITPYGQPTKKRVEVGRYKSTPNHVKTRTGEIFRFATPEETPALMEELINWYREKKEALDVNPTILAVEFHYRFIRIHPFDDGNGRIARILMNFILMQFGYPPVIIKTEDKNNYFSALQQADSGIVEPFFEYIAKNLVRSLEIMIAGAKGEKIDEPDDLDKEIALLEQKLKTVGKKIGVSVTRELVLDIYDNSIQKLIKLFIDACKKFDKFYAQNEFCLAINKDVIRSQNLAVSIVRGRDLINDGTYSVTLIYYHRSFNQEGFGEFGHTSGVEFNFGPAGYVINTAERRIFGKNYGDQLTEEERDQIVKIESQRHKEIIEEKLKEIQSKKI